MNESNSNAKLPANATKEWHNDGARIEQDNYYEERGMRSI